MNAPANVHSLEAIREFRGALIRFGEQSTDSLDSIHAQIHRFVDWLQHDRRTYWQQQVRRGYDQIAEARKNLHQCQMRTVGDHRPACIEEKQVLEQAKRRLELAQHKVKLVGRWQRTVDEEINEFRGRCGQLDHLLEHDLPHMRGLLDRILESLEGYVAVQAPELPAVETSEEKRQAGEE